MEEKKFCKFCGEEIDKSSVVCPKCGRQLQIIKNVEKPQTEPKDEPNNKINNQPKFYTQSWFMWVMLVFFAPVGIFLMWKFHPEMKKKLKIILTIIFAILFLIIFASSEEDSNDETDDNKYETNKKVAVEVIDFSSMTNAEIDIWCNENKVNCSITQEYSDTIAKDKFISQSVENSKTIYQGDKIKIVFSLGKEPTMGQKNALKKAESYSKTLYMSKKGIYNQLTSTFEGFTDEEAQYAIDNIKADWKSNALEKAKSYQQTMSMSKSAIYNQLTSSFEGFTAEEAQYAIDHLED